VQTRQGPVLGVAVMSAKNHKRQHRKRRSVTTANREKSQTPKFVTANLTEPNLTNIMIGLPVIYGNELWRLRLLSFGGYKLALASLTLAVFGAIECIPRFLPAP